MSGPSEARARILERIRAANAGRARAPHPGDFEGWPAGGAADGHVGRFVERFTSVGGEVLRVPDLDGAAERLRSLASGVASIAVGAGVPGAVVPALPRVDAAEAGLAISAARAGVAETGSVVLDARDGRRTQLLAATHVVLLDEARVGGTLRDVLRAVREDLPAALGLHSGPSKSADIGQVMVKGVHGPGRLVVVLVGSPPDPTGEGAPA